MEFVLYLTRHVQTRAERWHNLFFFFVCPCFRCVCGLLKNKPRILVTHQLQYLKAADQILVLKEVGGCTQ